MNLAAIKILDTIIIYGSFEGSLLTSSSSSFSTSSSTSSSSPSSSSLSSSSLSSSSPSSSSPSSSSPSSSSPSSSSPSSSSPGWRYYEEVLNYNYSNTLWCDDSYKKIKKYVSNILLPVNDRSDTIPITSSSFGGCVITVYRYDINDFNGGTSNKVPLDTNILESTQLIFKKYSLQNVACPGTHPPLDSRQMGLIYSSKSPIKIDSASNNKVYIDPYLNYTLGDVTMGTDYLIDDLEAFLNGGEACYNCFSNEYLTEGLRFQVSCYDPSTSSSSTSSSSTIYIPPANLTTFNEPFSYKSVLLDRIAAVPGSVTIANAKQWRTPGPNYGQSWNPLSYNPNCFINGLNLTGVAYNNPTVGQGSLVTPKHIIHTSHGVQPYYPKIGNTVKFLNLSNQEFNYTVTNVIAYESNFVADLAVIQLDRDVDSSITPLSILIINSSNDIEYYSPGVWVDQQQNSLTMAFNRLADNKSTVFFNTVDSPGTVTEFLKYGEIGIGGDSGGSMIMFYKNATTTLPLLVGMIVSGYGAAVNVSYYASLIQSSIQQFGDTDSKYNLRMVQNLYTSFNPVTGVTCTPDTFKINISWSFNNQATAYSVYRSISNDTTSMVLVKSGLTLLSYDDTDVNLITGVTYYYSVRAVNTVSISDYSTIISGQLIPLNLPSSPSDYEVWGTGFIASGSDPAITNESGWNAQGKPNFSIFKTISGTITYNSNFPFKAIVPGLYPPIGSGSNGFNGTRKPDDLTYNPSDSNWNLFYNTISAIPVGRRGITLYSWWNDVGQIYHKTSHDYYLTTLDATDVYAPANKKYLTFWLDQAYTNAKTYFSGFIQKCKDTGLVFDCMMDNKEFMLFWYLGGPNTDEKNGAWGDKRSVYGESMTTDSRLITALVEDSRITTKINPKTGKTFAQQFLDNFKELWNNNILLGGAGKLLPVGPITAEYPSGRPLEWTDLVKYIFTETTREKTISGDKAIDTKYTSGALTTDGSIFGDANGFFANRIRLSNFWNQYNANSGAGTDESNPHGCPSSGGSYKGAENWLLNQFGKYYGTALGDSDIKTWYDTWVNPILLGTPKLTGYILFHLVSPAWNAAVDSWIFSYYTRSTFMNDVLDPTNTLLNHVKYINYEMTALNSEEINYYSGSNGERFFRNNNDADTNAMPYCGEQFYGMYNNLLYPGGPDVTLDMGNTPTPAQIIEWKNRNSYISGYVKTPLTSSLHERYSFVGHNQVYYGGPSCNNIVRYPETNLVDTSDNWLPDNVIIWLKEFIYKMLVNNVKDMRHYLRSSPTHYSGWPIIGPDGDGGGTTNWFKYSYGYWYEMMFHLILNNASTFINIYGYYYPSKSGGIRCSQNVFDEWRNVSKNVKPLPCSNSTGNPSIPVDRIEMGSAFELYLLSGGKLPNSNTYIWRLTVPPKYFGADGTVTLEVDGRDTDIPRTITIDSKLDVGNVLSGIQVSSTPSQEILAMGSRGVWIKRNISTPPKYKYV